MADENIHATQEADEQPLVPPTRFDDETETLQRVLEQLVELPV